MESKKNVEFNDNNLHKSFIIKKEKGCLCGSLLDAGIKMWFEGSLTCRRVSRAQTQRIGIKSKLFDYLSFRKLHPTQHTHTHTLIILSSSSR